MAGYLPTNEGDQIIWLQNYIVKIAVHGPVLGMTAQEIAEQQRLAQLQIDKINAANAAAAAHKTATEDKNAQKKTSLDSIRETIAHLKTNPGCTDSIIKDLQAEPAANTFDPATYKTTVKLSVVGNQVQIAFIKGGVEGVNVYTRLQGEAKLEFLGHATHTPYIDPRPLKTPGVAEIREYVLMGEYKDKEIGQPSDVASITFGG